MSAPQLIFLPIAKKNTALVFYIGLQTWNVDPDLADIKIFQSAPTLAGGDVKISKNGGAFVDLTNLPTVTPPASKSVQVSLTAAEMNAENVVILFSDVAGDEWVDLLVSINTTDRDLDDLAYPQRTIVDSIAADGSLPTWEQTLYTIYQFLLERTVAGTTVTVKKVDGSTTLFTLQLDNPVNPTSITRLT